MAERTVWFGKGARVRLNARGRAVAKKPFRVGTYIGMTRDMSGDRVRWDDMIQPRTLNHGFLELVPEEE